MRIPIYDGPKRGEVVTVPDPPLSVLFIAKPLNLPVDFDIHLEVYQYRLARMRCNGIGPFGFWGYIYDGGR